MIRMLWPALVAATLFGTTVAQARVCDSEQFAAVVDATGAKLRAEGAKNEAGMRDKFRQLAKQKSWPDNVAAERGIELLADEHTRTLDAQASELLIRLDRLADTDGKPATCERLDELERVGKQLLEVTAVRHAHVSAKLSVALKPRLAARDAGQGKTKADRAESPGKAPAAQPAPTVKRKPPPGGASSAWSTQTTAAEPPPKEVMAQLPAVVPKPAAMTFGSHEIRAAGHGLFGSMSAELASVIKFAFDSYGKPNGYVLGTEGGAAFLAGLRYGHGQLVTKQFGERKIYWQGPSVGWDIGVTGSRVMMLVYNLDDPARIYNRFVGVEGAAYLVGGVGITFHQQGRLVLAPIRTGLGLRLGANVGYLKITPRRNYNPF